MEKKSHLVLIISIVTVILLAMLVGILVYFNLPAQRIRRMCQTPFNILFQGDHLKHFLQAVIPKL